MRLVLILCFLMSAFPGYALAQDSGDLCKLTDDAIAQASKIRGLSIKRKVPCLLEDKEQVKAFILSSLDTKLPENKIEMEELLYKGIGLITEEFNYKEGMVQLYTDQLGGYYDPEKKQYVMAAWLPAVMQTSVAVHELTHALQDQYYDLGKIIDNKIDNSDLLLASSALVEGDATAVMIDYSRALMGQGGIENDQDISGVMLQNVLGVGLLSGAQQVPMALKLTMVFPYTSGLNFVHSLLTKGGYRKVDSAFRRLPRSTEEILHPEKYLAGETDYVDVPDPKLADTDPKVIYRDVVGEFSISALLSNYLPDKNKCALAAAGWGGDKAVIFEADLIHGHRVLWETRWDTEQDSKEFYEAAVEMLKVRAALPVDVKMDGDTTSANLPKDRAVTLKKDGKTVTWLWSEKGSNS